MKTFRLRAVYDTTNLGFSDEGLVADGIVIARLVRQCEFFIATPRVTGMNQDGKKNLRVDMDPKVFQGHPLLLELTTTKDAFTTAYPGAVRPELESRLAECVAVLTWSLQGVVGDKLADELCSRLFRAFPTESYFNDVVPFELTDYFPDVSGVVSRVGNTRHELQNHPEARHTTAVTAMRWWRHARHTLSPLDRFLAHWIVLEMFSDYIIGEESVQGRKNIRERVTKAIPVVFPALAQPEGSQRAVELASALYSARCECVHTGSSDICHQDSVFQLTAATAHACIRFLVDGSVSAPPEHILKMVEI